MILACYNIPPEIGHWLTLLCFVTGQPWIHLPLGDVSKFLTHWGRVTHICVSNLTIIGPDNGLSPGRRQAIIWTNAGILLIGPWGTNFSEISIGIYTFSFNKIHLEMSSAKWRPFCLVLNVLKVWSPSSLYRMAAWPLAVELLWCECHRTWLIIGKRWFRCRDAVVLCAKF